MREKQQKKDNITKNITLEKLAQITNQGFSEVNKKFLAADKISKKIEGDITEMRGGMNGMQSQLTDIRVEMRQLKDSVDEKIKKGIDRMLTIADGMTKEFSIWKEENAVGSGVDTRQQEQLDDHERRIIKVEQTIKV